MGLDTQGVAGSSVALQHEQGVGTLLDMALKSPMSDKELTAITILDREVRICHVIYASFTSTLLCQHVMCVTLTAHVPQLTSWAEVFLHDADKRLVSANQSRRCAFRLTDTSCVTQDSHNFV